jgi:integrase
MDKKTLKDLRVGESCIISNDRQANPKLGAKLLSDGRASLFLDFYFGFTMVYNESQDKMVPKKQKRRESLNLYLYQKPRTPQERQENKDNLELANKLRAKRAIEITEPEKKEELKKKKASINFLDFFQEYIDTYTKKDVRMIQIALQRFKDFLKDTPEYNIYVQKIKPEQITNDMVEAFTEYLQTRSIGEGAKSIYQRFKKVYKACAIKCNINYQRPFVDEDGKSITITIDEDALVKDFLSPEEEKQLMATHYTGENPEIRNAFIFCLYTGMRWCDVRDLTFGDIDFANRLLTYEQNKTKGHSKHSSVTLPLTDGLLELVADKMEDAKKDTLVFTLPSHTMCLKALRRWTKRAGIDKHITWHCARHSFGTNMAMTAAQKGFSVRVVQEMMGHSSLKYTERYTRVVDEQKKQAMAELSKMMEG